VTVILTAICFAVVTKLEKTAKKPTVSPSIKMSKKSNFDFSN